jgi:hypothetical protein
MTKAREETRRSTTPGYKSPASRRIDEHLVASLILANSWLEEKDMFLVAPARELVVDKVLSTRLKLHRANSNSYGS